jgi:hypothetical protein
MFVYRFPALVGLMTKKNFLIARLLLVKTPTEALSNSYYLEII